MPILDRIRRSLTEAIEKHGDAPFKSVHESLGKCQEELYEVMKAIHEDENDIEKIRREFMDLATVALWSAESLNGPLSLPTKWDLSVPVSGNRPHFGDVVIVKDSGLRGTITDYHYGEKAYTVTFSSGKLGIQLETMYFLARDLALDSTVTEKIEVASSETVARSLRSLQIEDMVVVKSTRQHGMVTRFNETTGKYFVVFSKDFGLPSMWCERDELELYSDIVEPCKAYHPEEELSPQTPYENMACLLRGKLVKSKITGEIKIAGYDYLFGRGGVSENDVNFIAKNFLLDGGNGNWIDLSNLWKEMKGSK